MGLWLQVFGVGAVTWMLQKLFGAYFHRTTLDDVPGPPPPSFFTGHFGELMSMDSWAFLDNLADNYGGVVKLQALLGSKFLYVSDPVALHTMFVKEPNNFEESEEFLIGNQLLFGPGLAAASGEAHRKQRKFLNPAFAPQHIRQLSPVFFQVGETLRSAIAAQVRDGPKDVNIAAWTGRAALEVIGQGAMGHSMDPLVDEVSSEHAVALRSLMPGVFAVALHWFFIPWSVYLGPPKFRRWLLDMYPNKKAQQLKNIVDTVWNTSVSVVGRRRAAMERGEQAVNRLVGGGKDIMSLLLQANMDASEEDRIPDEQLVAQVNTIIFAASDTTSNALARILHTLVVHPEAQQKLRTEFEQFRNSGDELTYDRLIELPYLDAIVRETLRVHPPVNSMDRTVLQDTVLPLSKPITGVRGNLIREVAVTKGTALSLGIYAYNRSKDIWGEDAKQWKPERWLQPLPESARNAQSGGVFYNLMTFAGGPRSCIGFKYAELEIKTFLFHLIESFRFSPGKSEFVWNSSFTVFPSLTKESTKPEMPLRVEMIRNVA
ncbi:cytochrome P450-dit2 [Steccherinum ochraceum]|uniref:Cytochrome P450-dit2 n=1 Tax=Steccherinum ochraceum TaxID=92696 RepID=A0A4R0RN16_9APHY|nr:cytochrome P450-dit2 [Steccherinum ochraceum]